jgi:hypothetical protein
MASRGATDFLALGGKARSNKLRSLKSFLSITAIPALFRSLRFRCILVRSFNFQFSRPSSLHGKRDHRKSCQEK